MGYLGRRIGLSQDKGDSTPGGANGAVGGGILDLFASGYFERQDKTFNAPGAQPTGLTASGGIISDFSEGGTLYRAHTFTTSGSLVVTALGSEPAELEYLVVAGGGGGGSHVGGGGGAGGMKTTHPDIPAPRRQTTITATAGPTTYPVSIGAGGAGTTADGQSPPQAGGTGTNSVFGPVTANGGGGGGAGFSAGNLGGSGGGTGHGPSDSVLTPPAVPDADQGFRGGGAQNNPAAGAGGGGGAGAVGGDAAPGAGGDGGAGLGIGIIPSPPSINSGNGYFYAGGGGGGTYVNAHAGDGGRGGGGGGSAQGPDPNPPPAQGGVDGFQDGQAGGVAAGRAGGNGGYNTGGGAGGSAHPGGQGGFGGSGIVIVRYKIGSILSTKATGGSVSFYGGKTIHTFATSGTFTNTSGSDLTVEYIAIAGGGSGGSCNGPAYGGGGGAGGVVSNIPGFMPATTAAPVVGQGAPNALTVTVGAGGAKLVTGNSDVAGGDGVNTTITGPGPWSVTAYKGGGGGGNTAGAKGGNGSYGSGGGGEESEGTGGAGTPGQGNNGGAGNEGGDRGGGGGGAGEAGNTDGAGQGGDGVRLPSTYHNPQSTVGAPGPAGGYYVAGGGGGGSAASTPAAGGDGGGGAGGSDAVQNTGSGGGAKNDGSISGQGGSGLVIIAYDT